MRLDRKNDNEFFFSLPTSLQDVSASPLVSLPSTLNHPTSTLPIPQSNPFSILKPDTPVSTTSPIPILPPLHCTCRTRQPKHSTPSSPSTPSPTPFFSSAPRTSIPSSAPLKRAFVSQTSLFTSPPETLEDIKNFLDRTQENVLLPHSPSSPSTFKVFADINPSPQVPSTPLPPTLSQQTPFSPPCAPFPFHSPLSLPLLPEYSPAWVLLPGLLPGYS